MLEESISLWFSMYSWFTPTVLFVFLNLVIGTIAITSSLYTPKPSNESQHYPTNLNRSPSVLNRLKSINFYPYKSPEPEQATATSTSSPSVLQRLKSINFCGGGGFRSPEPEKTLDLDTHLGFNDANNSNAFSRSPSVIGRLKSFNFYNYITQEQETTQIQIQEPEEVEEQKEHEPKEEQPGKEQEHSPTLDEVYMNLSRGNLTHVSRTKSDTEPSAGNIPPKLTKKMRKSASTKSPFSHFEENEVVESRRPATVREGKSKEETEEDEAADEEVDARADDFINKFKQQLKLQRMDSIMRYKEMVKKGSEK